MKKTIIVALLFTLSIMSCKDATTAQYNALGKQHYITLYSASGDTIGNWESTGSVSNEQNSDGWYFEDVKSGKLIEVTGTLVITVK